MKTLHRRIAIATGTVLLGALGSTGVAVAANATPATGTHATVTAEPSGESSAESSKAPEAAGDQAKQDAACKLAGIPTTAENINFDDSTGVCTQGDGGGQNEN